MGVANTEWQCKGILHPLPPQKSATRAKHAGSQEIELLNACLPLMREAFFRRASILLCHSLFIDILDVLVLYYAYPPPFAPLYYCVVAPTPHTFARASLSCCTLSLKLGVNSYSSLLVTV